MSVFTRGLKAGQVEMTYAPIARTGALGTTTGESQTVTVLIDEGGSQNWQKTEAEHASNVLIYADPDGVLGQRSCVGGRLRDSSTGREFRIEGYDVAKNQRTGRVEHVELTAGEIL